MSDNPRLLIIRAIRGFLSALLNPREYSNQGCRPSGAITGSGPVSVSSVIWGNIIPTRASLLFNVFLVSFDRFAMAVSESSSAA